MKLSRSLIAAAALSAFAAAPAWADNSLTFQGVTFSTVALDSDTLELTITNALGATGDWTGIASFAAFEIKGVGSLATAASGGGVTWTYSDNALGANGCLNGNSDGGCFTASSPVALTNSMVFDIDFASALDGTPPHLKVLFLDANGVKTGSLLSKDLPVTVVPEPSTYALMFAGLGVVGFMTRRRKQQA